MPAPGYQWSAGFSEKNKKLRPVAKANWYSLSVTWELSPSNTAAGDNLAATQAYSRSSYSAEWSESFMKRSMLQAHGLLKKQLRAGL